MAPINTAAWFPSKDEKAIQISAAPYTAPLAGQIVVRNAALGVAPVDAAKHQLGSILLGYVKYPCILGLDIAGEVVEVGEGVTRFAVGDRVIGQAAGVHPDSNNPAEGGFQLYTVIREHLASRIPDSISYTKACVIPLGLVTAAQGLFDAEYLALPLPSSSPEDREQAIVITGGASSVGSNAIQLAVAAGYKVYSTSSTKNFDYVKSLGATKVYDYHDPKFVDDMIADLAGQTIAGAFVIGDGGSEAGMRILSHGGNGTKKFVAYAGSLPSPDQLTTRLGFAAFAGSTLWRVARTRLLSFTKGIPVKFIETKGTLATNGVIAKIFQDFLPGALSNGTFVPAPDPRVVGKSLDDIQSAIVLMHKGVSAQKLVVTLKQ